MAELGRLQSKYLCYDENGEEVSFIIDYLAPGEHDLHSDLTELFERGFYFTSNDHIAKRMIAFLNRENITHLITQSGAWRVKISL
jgi:hypothetical protein